MMSNRYRFIKGSADARAGVQAEGAWVLGPMGEGVPEG
jgi:hypothetical protein